MNRTLAMARALTLMTFVLAWTILGAAPAQAHTANPRFHTQLVSVLPALPGLSVTVADNGEWVTLTNTSDTTVVVSGYDGEPYLRIGRDGVWQNILSPSTYLNQSLQIVPVPDIADPTAPPRWVGLNTSTTARWHDRRMRWMGAEIPAVVKNDLGSSHLISTWTIRALQGDTPIAITGTLTWRPATGVYYALILPAVATLLLGVAGLVIPKVRRRRLEAREPAV
jgi:hypothetical protein